MGILEEQWEKTCAPKKTFVLRHYYSKQCPTFLREWYRKIEAYIALNTTARLDGMSRSDTST